MNGVKKNFYNLFGLLVESEIEFDLPLVESSSCDIRISFVENLPVISTPSMRTVTYSADNNQIHLFLRDGIQAVVTDGREILIKFPAVTDRLVDIIFSSCLPVLFIQRKNIVFHASASKVADGATLFLGDSGAGKSTMAKCLEDAGCVPLSDDGTVCRMAVDKVEVLPTLSSIRLLPDNMVCSRSKFIPGACERDKVSFPRRLPLSGAVELRSIVVLEWGETRKFDRLSRKDGMIQLLKHMSYPWFSQITLGELHLHYCAQICGKVPIFKFIRTRDSFNPSSLPSEILFASNETRQY